MIYYDCASCFDRMPPALSNLLLRKNRFDEGILLAREDAITGMQRHVRTGLGTSEDFYSEKPGEPALCGEIQGKADVPLLFTASSSAILKAHAALAPGLHLKSCTGERSIKRHNVSYVDDNQQGRAAESPFFFGGVMVLRRGPSGPHAVSLFYFSKYGIRL